MMHPAERDLRWLLQSPPLIDAQFLDADFLAESSRAFPAQDAIEELISERGSDLIQWMASRKRKRLGHYAEDLLIWWFQQQSPLKQFAHSIPIRTTNSAGGQRTLGELDFVWQGHDSAELEHWELAVKFYIRCGTSLGDYVGPNRKDTLERKWQRFINHQLPLANSEEAGNALNALFPTRQGITSRVLLKGWLFHPLVDGVVDLAATPPLSTGHATGWWSEVQTLQLPQQSRSSRYIALPKARWLAPGLFIHEQVDTLSHHQAQRDFGTLVNHQQQALMVIEAQRNLEGLWTEINRGFILPDNWSQSPLALR